MLSRGKHRSPRKGACFMELASYLAGEPWSDHPRCTHPLVAVVARLVNDHMSDGQRQRLAPLIPEVIGLTSDDGRVDANIALRCATSALPVAAAERQNVLVVAVLAAERALATMEGREPGELQPRSAAALESAPHAAARGRTFFGRFEMTVDESASVGHRTSPACPSSASPRPAPSTPTTASTTCSSAPSTSAAPTPGQPRRRPCPAAGRRSSRWWPTSARRTAVRHG